MPNKRIDKLEEKVNELDIIKKGKYHVEARLDIEDSSIGISIMDLSDGDPQDIVWVEDTEEGIDIQINPFIREEEEYEVDLWTILYCLSAGVKELDEEKYVGEDYDEIAEDIYDNSTLLFPKGLEEELYKDLKEELRIDSDDYELVESQDSDHWLLLDTSMNELGDLVAEYPREDMPLLIDFLNQLMVIGGEEDVQFRVIENLDDIDGTEDAVYLKELEDQPEEEIKTVREHMGVLDQNYITKNLSAMLEDNLNKEELDKDTLLFINQLIYERSNIETFIENVEGELGEYGE